MNDQATEPSITDELHDEAAENRIDSVDPGEQVDPADRIDPEGEPPKQSEHAEQAEQSDGAGQSDEEEAGQSDEEEAGQSDEEEQVEPPEPSGPTYQRFDCTDASGATALAAAATAARHAVEAGQCVVLPTDTVYGIGADAYDSDAVQRLLDAKGRGRDMPPPVLIADAKVLTALAQDIPEAVAGLVERFWPGALTVICTAKSSLRMDLGETRGTVAVRVPDHELARTLLRQTGPLAVSSANTTGHSAALTCQDAIDQLGDAVAVYLDGGTVGGSSGKPSTMIDFTIKDTGQVLRRGALSLAQLREYLPDLEDLTSDEPEHPDYTVAELRARHTLQPSGPTG